VESAHQKNIKIVLDLVYNHCSSDSRYFDFPGRYGNGAAINKQSPYYRWFDFDIWPSKYRGWAGLAHMPEFVECPEVEDFFLGENGITAYWLARGADGFRTDVTFDNTEEFWRRFRKRINLIKPDAYLVSEEWRNASHYLLGDTFSATMNYRFTWALWGFFAHEKLTATEMDDRLAVLRRDTPAPALHSQMNILSSHDTQRVLRACGDDKQKFLQMAAFQLAYPGAPMIYYGDEAGITSLDHCESGRKAFPWGKEDSEILNFYYRALAARRTSKALRYGDFYVLHIDDDKRVYIFGRQYKDEVVYAAFNAGSSAVEVTIPLSLHYEGHCTAEDLLGHYADSLVTGDAMEVTLQPGLAGWFRIRES
ncbi:MAG: alpha-glucosidase C-terminal domain-containing protein, partial [Anaerolineae bacterium]|nr:alpha-glucosidase C-terminal domain-containing protein [Anaerolineae bacterium]